MNRLKNSTVYLAGNIDYAPDLGMGWRDAITPFLKDELGITVINPCKKPKNLINSTYDEDNDFRLERIKLKSEGKYKELHNLMNPIIQADLHFVDISNFMIVGLDVEKKPCGSIWEMCIGNLARKPILIVSATGKNQINDWLFGLLPDELFFDTWNELKEYLRHVDSAENINTYGRWRLFDLNR